MNIIVDTSVWSLVLRRPQVEESHPFVIAFRNAIQEECTIHLLGNILQELLDGTANHPHHFDHLKTILKPFPFLSTTRENHTHASQLRNLCRKKGIQASPVDFLITATCIDHGYPLLTSDKDFTYIAKYCALKIYPNPILSRC